MPERPGANHDGIGLRDAQRLDLDAAAGRLHFTNPVGPRLWRHILKAAHDRIDIAVDRLPEQRMKAGGAPARCSVISITG